MGELVQGGFQREVALAWPGPRMDVGTGMFSRAWVSRASTLGQAYAVAESAATGSRFSSSTAIEFLASWLSAVRCPLGSAPSLMRWAVLVRCPIPVNICGRVSTSFTGRPAVRAASTVKTTCGQTRSPAPNPPPTNGASTRIPLSGTPKAAASVARTL